VSMKNFRNLMINTPEGPLPWAKGKWEYLDVGIAGMAENIIEGDQSGAQQSYNVLKPMFYNIIQKTGNNPSFLL